MSASLTYEKAGVDSKKAAALISKFKKGDKKNRDKNILSGIGPFAACYDLNFLKKWKSPVLVTSCDGVGTKLKLALDWNQVSNLGQDLVAMNVNDLLCAGATPKLFLDYYACGKLEPVQYLSILESIRKACLACNTNLVGGETAEMPGLYQNEDFDLAGFATGFAEKKHLLGGNRVKPKDIIIGLKSSGVHSNGFSLVRKIVEKDQLKPEETPSFSKKSWRDLLLAPTHLYVSAVGPLVPFLHAAVHITGGGLYENMPRVLPPNLSGTFDKKAWELPPLFQYLQNSAQLSWDEMMSTFNCGYGMLLIGPEKDLLKKLKPLKAFTPTILGVIEKGKSKVVWR